MIKVLVCFYAMMSLVAMAPMNIAFFALTPLFLAVCFQHARARRTLLPQTNSFQNYKKSAGLLFVACFLSLVVAKVWPVAYAGHDPEVTWHGIFKIWYLSIPLVISVLIVRAKDPSRFLKAVQNAWWIGTIIMAPVSIIQYFTGFPLKQEIPTNPGHFHGILWLGHHLSVASVFIFPCFTGLATSFEQWKMRQALTRLPLLAGFAGLLILFLTYARTAWLTLPLGIFLILIRYLKPRERLFSLGALLIVCTALTQVPLIKSRIENGMGIHERVQLWQANIDFFKRNPLTGIGWLKTQEMSEFYFKSIDPDHYREHFWGHAHSNFFEMLGGTGLIGLLAFLIWTWFSLNLAYELARYSAFAYGLFVALLLLHINGLTNVTFWEGKVMHAQMLAVAILLVMDVLSTKKKAP